METSGTAKRRRQNQFPQDLPSMDDAIVAGSRNLLQLQTQLAAPEQSYIADFSSYWGGRRNGWSPHALIFSTRAATGGSGSSSEYFLHDKQTGTIRILRDDVVLKIEVWWKGRAPWGYHYVQIVRNMVYSGEGEPPQGSGMCALSDEECDKQHASESYCSCVFDHRRLISFPAGFSWKLPAAEVVPSMAAGNTTATSLSSFAHPTPTHSTCSTGPPTSKAPLLRLSSAFKLTPV